MKKAIIVVSVLCIVCMYLVIQIDMYRVWVKQSTIEGFEACMAFHAVSKLGIDFCTMYARDPNLYSPYPIVKALL